MTTTRGATAAEFVLTDGAFFAAATTVRWVMMGSPLGRDLPDPHLRLAAVAVIVGAVLAWAPPSPWGRHSVGHLNPAATLGLWLTGVFPGRRRCTTPLLAGFVVGNGRLARLVRGPAADRLCRD
ncbi:aquaporin [Streptomyces sp. NBC_00365]|uniref:aquaporin n=1 Tax=Streptomyces sp. NBC_00365 TaxID=2975726 RepID=UPI002255D608|nr:aquaporin [Streptomyces sp. NBC_00365]MCX5093825.1 aquaporin [Streptomyces sp. NBC_00365]